MLTQRMPTRLVLAGAAVILLMSILPPPAVGQYKQFNLVSDLPRSQSHAIFRDPNLVNPWGIVASPTSPFWVADNGTGVSTLYKGVIGIPFPLRSHLVVTVPPPPGSTDTAAPTGIIFNGTSSFVVSSNGNSGQSRFIFATEDGTISGWSPAVDVTHAIVAVDNSESEAIYKGLAVGTSGTNNYIYATNFHRGVVEIYDGNFNFVSWFTDPDIVPDSPEPGMAPFGIRNINGNLYVTFAMQDEDKEDDVRGAGLGFIDVFDLQGNFVRRFATGGALNAPWGLAMAPSKFGQFSGDLLIGNFGDGRINAYNPSNGNWVGQLADVNGNPIEIEGLWGLIFGNGVAGQNKNFLFFTAGIEDESHGLFGRIQAVGQ